MTALECLEQLEKLKGDRYRLIDNRAEPINEIPRYKRNVAALEKAIEIIKNSLID